MTSVRSGLMPTAVAVGLTALLGGVFTVVQGNDEIMLPVLGVVGFLSLMMPFGLPVVWAWALLKSRPHKIVLAGAALWLLAGIAMMPAELTWHLTTHVVTGLVVAMGLLSRWKPELILLIMVLVSLPMIYWTLDNEPIDEMFDQYKVQALEDRRELLKAGTKAGENAPTLAQEEQFLEDALLLVRQLLPGSMVLVQFGQSGLTFGLIWVLVRVLGFATVFRRFPSFDYWRLPFSVIWVLAAAVAMMIIQPGFWPELGVNLALVIVTLLAAQGAAVQWKLSKVSFGLLPRLFFLVMASLLFMPLVLLGLADQWLDFRKLNEVEPEGSI